MASTEDLRDAPNQAAVHTEALCSEEVLRLGRRHRTRRNLAVFGGGAAAFAVLAAGAFTTFNPGPAELPAAAPNTAPAGADVAPSPEASSRTVSMPVEHRYVFEGETVVERGVYSTVIVDKTLPEDVGRAGFVLHRVPGTAKLPKPTEDSSVLTAGKTTVRVEKYEAEAGTDRQLEWVSDNTLFAMQAYAVRARDGRAFVPTDEELKVLVEYINARFAGKR
ncbi:hypothetical protein [Actinoplanes sp. NPDC049802]|uniref:hypothetical protein n=1 Tax=Actinoplanes sp. NPDC049802 TaxID=3154742 RepID=UPI0033FDF94B